MSSKQERKIKTKVATSSSKVPLPNFLSPDCLLYTSDFFYACFYISMILIDYKFLPGNTYLEVDQLEEEMNKITNVEDYKNEKLLVVDAGTNTRMVETVSKYDPDLSCWHNFHVLVLVTHYILVAGFDLNTLKSWESDTRYHAWFFLLQYHKTCTEEDLEDFEPNDYLLDCFKGNEEKKTFKKFVELYTAKELWSRDAMEVSSKGGFWSNVKHFFDNILSRHT